VKEGELCDCLLYSKKASVVKKGKAAFFSVARHGTRKKKAEFHVPIFMTD